MYPIGHVQRKEPIVLWQRNEQVARPSAHSSMSIHVCKKKPGILQHLKKLNLKLSEFDLYVKLAMLILEADVSWNEACAYASVV